MAGPEQVGVYVCSSSQTSFSCGAGWTDTEVVHEEYEDFVDLC